MTRTAGNELSRVLTRVRQQTGPGIENAFVLQLLSICQHIVNASTQEKQETTQLIRTAQKFLYKYRTELTSSIDIISIEDSGREVQYFDALEHIAAYDHDGMNATGSRAEFWYQIGRDLLIIWPSKGAADSLSVTYSKLTTELNDSNDEFEIPDESVDLADRLTELILLLRSRQLSELTARLETFK